MFIRLIFKMFISVENETSKCPSVIVNRPILGNLEKKKKNIHVKSITAFKYCSVYYFIGRPANSMNQKKKYL